MGDPEAESLRGMADEPMPETESSALRSWQASIGPNLQSQWPVRLAAGTAPTPTAPRRRAVPTRKNSRSKKRTTCDRREIFSGCQKGGLPDRISNTPCRYWVPESDNKG